MRGLLLHSEAESLKFKFKNNKLKLLYKDGKNPKKYPKAVVKKFLAAITIIRSIESERDLYTMPGMRFEKLEGKRGNNNERSLRLNDQWRLIICIQKDELGKYIYIIDVVDYH